VKLACLFARCFYSFVLILLVSILRTRQASSIKCNAIGGESRCRNKIVCSHSWFLAQRARPNMNEERVKKETELSHGHMMLDYSTQHIPLRAKFIQLSLSLFSPRLRLLLLQYTRLV